MVFVLGNMNMSNTDAEGRVAAGGNVTLSNYGVGRRVLSAAACRYRRFPGH